MPSWNFDPIEGRYKVILTNDNTLNLRRLRITNGS
jgi:hypothetical protein